MSPAEITDPEILAFIAASALPGPEGEGIAAQRAAYDALCDVFRAPRPPGVAVLDDSLDGPDGPVPRRHYTPPGAGPVRIVYFHGGGFVLGGLHSHDDICAELAARTGCPLTSVDYRLAPEHPHPAAYRDALAAARAALATGPAILAGDSAGGGLAASVALALRGEAGLRGQVLIYPGLGGETLGLASYRDRAEAPLLTTADVHAYRALRAGGPPPEDDPSFAALAAVDLAGTAPACVSAAEVDPLRDDGVEHVRRLRAAGVPAACVVEPQLPHGWLRARHRSARAAAAFDRLCAATRALAAGQAPAADPAPGVSSVTSA